MTLLFNIWNGFVQHTGNFCSKGQSRLRKIICLQKRCSGHPKLNCCGTSFWTNMTEMYKDSLNNKFPQSPDTNMCTCLATNKAFMPAKAWKVYYERKFKREESNINRTRGDITYVVHPSRALSGRKEKIKNKNSVLRFFFSPIISVHWYFCLCNWGVESSQSFYFFTYQKRITSFWPPNPHKQKSKCTRIVKKKSQ